METGELCGTEQNNSLSDGESRLETGARGEAIVDCNATKCVHVC